MGAEQSRPPEAARRSARGSRRAARKSARGSGRPHAGLHATPHAALRSRKQVRTRLRRPAHSSGQGHGDSWSCPGKRSLPPPRLWKLTGCGKLRATGRPAPGPSHNRWKSRPPSTAQGFPQLRTASATRSQEGRRGRRKPQIDIFPYTEPRARGTTPPGPPRELRREMTTQPPTRSRSPVRMAGLRLNATFRRSSLRALGRVE